MDLTQSNVLIHNGEPWVSDFGIAVRVPASGPTALQYTHSTTSKLLIHPFAVAPDVLKQYYAAVDVVERDGPQSIDMRGQGVR